MEPSDYFRAWDLISTWNDPAGRNHQLRAVNASLRRPYLLFAMIRIAAALSDESDFGEDLVSELAQNGFIDAVDGVLDITDQVLDMLSPNADALEMLGAIAAGFAQEEPFTDSRGGR